MKPASTVCLDDQLIVRANYAHKEFIKAIPGRKWDPEQKAWVLPATPEAAEQLKCIAGMRFDEATLELIAESAPQRTVTAGDSVADEPIAPMPVKLDPFKHQIKGYNLGITCPEAAILAEMGTGKSFMSVAIAGRRYLDGQVKRLLVVAPLSVVPVWPREFADYADYPVNVTVLTGSAAKKKAALKNGLGLQSAALEVMVINYESAWRIEDDLMAWRPDMIICDESQRIKTHNSKQSKALHRMGKKTKYKLILTGTPVNNSPLDFWSQYQFLKPGLFPTSFYAFRNRYALMGGYGGYEILGYKHMDELTDLAHSIAYRITKKEALDLPEAVDQTLFCELEPEARKLYKKLAREKAAEIEGDKQITTPEIIVKLLRLSQIAGGYVKADEDEQLTQVSKAKIKVCTETVTDLLDEGRKVVLFARFTAEIDDLCNMAENLVGEGGYRAIHGAVPSADRGAAVNDFQTDDSVKIFIAQIQTAGLGITLTAADTAIFYSMDYSYANYAQAKARIHRIGQKNCCTYIHLLAAGTVDEQVLAALENKRDLAADIVDNWREVFINQ